LTFTFYLHGTISQKITFFINTATGRAIAQAVSRRLPTAAARVRPRVRSRGICGGPSGNGAGFLRVLRFPLSILIPPAAPQSPTSIIRGWYNGQNSGRRTKCCLTPSQETKNYSSICLGLRKTRNISPDNRCPDRDSNVSLPECKSEAEPPELTCSVTRSLLTDAALQIQRQQQTGHAMRTFPNLFEAKRLSWAVLRPAVG
jgi:hypothetical protein